MIFLTARPAKIMKPFRLNAFIKQCVAYALSFLLVFGSSAPSIADILTSQSVEHSLAKNPVYINEPTSDYMYRTPAFVEWPTSRSKSLASMYDQLLTEDSTTIGDAKFIPIGVGDITTFIPVYPKYQYIGTPPVQARYVRTQIMALLGRNLIDGDDSRYATEAKQLDTLFDQAITYAKNTDYRYGDNLKLDQEASGLSQDMIWPELRVVNGKSVIVPVVYLTHDTISHRRVINNEQQLAKNTNIGQLNVVNTDIRFARDTLLRVTDLLARNSTISGTGNLEIVAEGDFDNASSIISTNCTDPQGRQLGLGVGGCDLTIGAKNIKNNTIVYRYDLEHEQGSHYGQIAKLASHGGNLILTAHKNIEFNGADATALNGAITLSAEGDIRIGTQELYSGSADRFGSGTQARSEVSFLQSHLTAEDTIKLIAKGKIVLDAAELVSDKGHIQLLAGLGITVVDALGVKQSQASGKFGKKKVDESVYQTVAIRSLLDAGKGITLSTDFGDITLKAANITSGQGTSVNAKKGAVNLLMTTETDHYSYSSVKKGLFTTKTVSKGRNIETGVPNSIVGGFAVEALNGITVEYEGDPTLSTEQQLDKIAAMPGMEWIDDVRNSPDVDWNEILLAHEQWYDKTTSLSPAFAAVVAIAVAVATGGAGGAVAGAITSSGSVVASAVVTAGVNAFVSQAVMAGINGAVNGDIGGAMEDLASSDTLKSLAVAMVTAGAIAQVDATFFNVDSAGVAEASEAVESASTAAQAQTGVNSAINATKAAAGGMSLTAQVGEAVTHAVVKAGIQAAVYDDVKFDDAFRQSLMQSATDAVGQYAAGKIGSAFDTEDAAGIETALKYISHAAVGCVIGVASASVSSGGDAKSNCYAQGGGAVIGELIASTYRDNDKLAGAQEDLEEYLESKTGRVDALIAEGHSEQKIQEILKAETGQLIRDVRVLAERGVDLAKLGAAVGAFAAGADAAGVNAAAAGAENAARYNAMSLDFTLLKNAIEEVRALLANPFGPLELLTSKLADSVIAIGVDLENTDPAMLADALEGALKLTGIDVASLISSGIDVTNPSVSAGLIAAVIDTVGLAAILGDVTLRAQLSPFLGADLNEATIERAEQAVDGTVELVRNIDQVLPAMKTLMDEAIVNDDAYAKAQLARLIGGVTIGMAVGSFSVIAAPETLGASLVTLGAASALRLQKTLALLKTLSLEGKINLDKVLDKLPFDVKFRANESGDGFDVDIGARDVDLDNIDDVTTLLPIDSSAATPAHNAANYAKHIELLSVTELANPLVDSLRTTGKLPSNYIDKPTAVQQGWKPGKALGNSVPDGQLGGDIFENSTNVLPSAQGRVWYEADIGIKTAMSRPKQPGTRLLYSNDGLLYVTPDHYDTVHLIGRWKD